MVEVRRGFIVNIRKRVIIGFVGEDIYCYSYFMESGDVTGCKKGCYCSVLF